MDDFNLQVSRDEPVTTTGYSANQLPLQSVRNIGPGTPLLMRVRIGTAFVGGTSVQFNVIAHYTTSAATDAGLGLISVIGSSEVLTTALGTLTAAAEYEIPLGPIGNRKLDLFSAVLGNTVGAAYLSLGWVVSGTYTAGTITAGIVLQPRAQIRTYPASTNT